MRSFPMVKRADGAITFRGLAPRVRAEMFSDTKRRKTYSEYDPTLNTWGNFEVAELERQARQRRRARQTHRHKRTR